MMYEEFCGLVETDRELPTFEQYTRWIEPVYVWHPLNLSKETCAILWQDFGLLIFQDMHPRARMALCIENSDLDRHDKNATYELIQDDVFTNAIEDEWFAGDEPIHINDPKA